MVRKRILTPEEKLLWKHITRNDKPLVIDAAEPEEIEPRSSVKLTKVKPAVKTEITKNKLKTPEIKASKLKVMGDYSGIDKNTAERFRKGDAPIDATLDLHGMTREKAHKALMSFISRHIKLESRRLLVITGKGSGILRTSLPNWLDSPDLAGEILAYDVAKQKHGGAGAYYILLKRKRK